VGGGSGEVLYSVQCEVLGCHGDDRIAKRLYSENGLLG
jgi:hypothetical protein